MILIDCVKIYEITDFIHSCIHDVIGIIIFVVVVLLKKFGFLIIKLYICVEYFFWYTTNFTFFFFNFTD